MTQSYGYYPGCSLSGGGVELDLSIRAVSRVAGAGLQEIGDWNCCGASSAHCLSHDLAVALPYRVLALAESRGLSDVVAPCAACFSRLKGTNVRLSRDPKLSERMLEIVGKPYRGSVRILSAIDFLRGLLQDGLQGKLSRPFQGLKAAPYYGCLLSRGQGIIESDDPEDPSAMTEVLRAAGCEAVPWNFATECCGGGFSMSMTESILDLSGAILDDARQAGAQIVVTGCPMCHSNLDMRQRELVAVKRLEGPVPVLYLSEVLGLAAGLSPEELGLDRHFIDAAGVCGGTR